MDKVGAAKVTNGMILEAASALNLAAEEREEENRMEMMIMDSDFNTTSAAMGSDRGRAEALGGELIVVQ